MKKNISKRFFFNISRVRNLIEIYSAISKPNVRGITYKEDVLRSAVVMLHASLEDLLRGLLEWKLPTASPDQLREIHFSTSNGNEKKLSLEDLTRYRGKKVNDVITEVVQQHLDKASYNNVRDITKALEQLGLSAKDFKDSLSALAPVIKRRHQIVHQSDRKRPELDSHGKPMQLTMHEVVIWANVIKFFGRKVLKKVSTQKEKRLTSQAK